MKNILSKVTILFLGLIILSSCKKDKTTKGAPNAVATKGIKLNISGLNVPSKTLYFYNYDAKIDSLVITKNGLIELKPSWRNSQILFLYEPNSKLEFFYEKDNLDLDLVLTNNIVDMKKSSINYSKETLNNKAYKLYSNTLDAFIEKDERLSKEWQELLKKYKTSEELSKHRGPLDNEFNELIKDRKTYFKDYITTNSNAISQHILLKDMRFYYDAKTLEKILIDTPESNRTYYYEQLQAKLTILKKLEIGAESPNIISNGIDGKEKDLYSLRGSYVLVDFWASWCSSCRKENPWVKKAYEAYKDKNFKVYSVSLDYPNQRDNWLKAIEDDKMNNFVNVSLLLGWRDPVAKSYNLSGIPSPYLLDPSGKILAKGEDLREGSLLEHLAKHIK